MSVEAYRSLIDQLCQHTGIPNPQAMYDKAELLVDDCKFMLKHGEKSESVLIYCDMGELPEKSKEAALLRLMETNLYMFGDLYNPVFSYNPETRHVLMLYARWLGDATGLTTLALIQQLSEMAKEWRESYFLDDKEAKSGTLAGPRAGANSSLDRFKAQFGNAAKAPQKAK
jgi:hypothetical protein